MTLTELTNTDYVLIAAVIGLLGTVSAGLIGGIFYLWRKDPAGKINGTISELISLTRANSNSIAWLIDDVKEHRAQHAEILSAIEKLADAIAPRRPRG